MTPVKGSIFHPFFEMNPPSHHCFLSPERNVCWLGGGEGSFSHPNTEKWQCFCCWEGRGLAWGGCVGQSVGLKQLWIWEQFHLHLCLFSRGMTAPEAKLGPPSGPSVRCRMWAELSPAKAREVLFAAFRISGPLTRVITFLWCSSFLKYLIQVVENTRTFFPKYGNRKREPTLGTFQCVEKDDAHLLKEPWAEPASVGSEPRLAATRESSYFCWPSESQTQLGKKLYVQPIYTQK